MEPQSRIEPHLSHLVRSSVDITMNSKIRPHQHTRTKCTYHPSTQEPKLVVKPCSVYVAACETVLDVSICIAPLANAHVHTRISDAVLRSLNHSIYFLLPRVIELASRFIFPVQFPSSCDAPPKRSISSKQCHVPFLFATNAMQRSMDFLKKDQMLHLHFTFS